MNTLIYLLTFNFLRRFVAIFLIVFSLIGAVPAEYGKTEATQLVGTWKLVSYNYIGLNQKLSPDEMCIKTFTQGQYTWNYYNPTSRKTIASGAGTYQLEANMYSEKGAFIHQAESDFRSGAYRNCVTKPEDLQEMYLAEKHFQVNTRGDIMSFSGSLANGTPIEETWQRVK